ncbi:esterase [Klebsiella pneumoniae]|uniref:Esterase n=1 Tax=Klebsiella pneumoniae TaxID=573 RepID=A0A377ZZK1_KLEPN|nr:esterase [Klebsiella pneumoniae]
MRARLALFRRVMKHHVTLDKSIMRNCGHRPVATLSHMTTTGLITLPDAESAKAWLISANG